LTREPAAHWWIDAASGAAPRAVRGLFASWIELNPEARATAQSLDVLGGLLVGEGDPDGLPPLPDISDPARQDRFSVADPLYPSPLTELGFRSAIRPWRSRMGGIRARKIETWCEPGVDARLFRFDADAGIPAHDHHGDEFTLVLAGGFSDQEGVYHRGDLSCAHSGILHEPRGLPDESCICLTVSIGGYRFRNPLMALISSFLK
tara:strand:- start:23 stop:637 length:615 start_codon:yes stop_codon:yes gene_type:complete